MNESAIVFASEYDKNAHLVSIAGYGTSCIIVGKDGLARYVPVSGMSHTTFSELMEFSKGKESK